LLRIDNNQEDTNMKRILGLRVGSAVFALVCLGQLLRLAMQVEVLAGGHRLPFWASAVAAAIAGGLSFWLSKLSKPEFN
jgi:hypothetical protein